MVNSNVLQYTTVYYSKLYMSPQDLEIAADFSVQVPPAELLSVLHSSDHVQVWTVSE